jgi:hypothetical protein
MSTSGRPNKPVQPAEQTVSDPAGEGRLVDEAGLREEIERTREELGETVEQLVAKTDVQSRVRHRAADLGGRAKSWAAQARSMQGPAPLVVAAVTLIAGYLVFRWGRKR